MLLFLMQNLRFLMYNPAYKLSTEITLSQRKLLEEYFLSYF